MARILAVGTHPEVMPVIERLIRSQDGWEPIVACCADDALTVLASDECIDVLLVGAGLSPDEEVQLNAAAGAQKSPSSHTTAAEAGCSSQKSGGF